MKKEILNDAQGLLLKPLWQMTGREFIDLVRVSEQYGDTTSPENHLRSARVTGVQALAEHIGCCASTIFMLRRNGVLDEAVVSQVGRKIVFDAEKARALAAAYQTEQRKYRKSTSQK